MRYVALACMVGIGCAASTTEPAVGGASVEASEGSEPQVVALDLEAQSERMRVEFDDALALAAPDCERAAELRDALCELSARICSVEREHPEEGTSRCAPGRARCESARERFEERCR